MLRQFFFLLFLCCTCFCIHPVWRKWNVFWHLVQCDDHLCMSEHLSVCRGHDCSKNLVSQNSNWRPSNNQRLGLRWFPPPQSESSSCQTNQCVRNKTHHTTNSIFDIYGMLEFFLFVFITNKRLGLGHSNTKICFELSF